MTTQASTSQIRTAIADHLEALDGGFWMKAIALADDVLANMTEPTDDVCTSDDPENHQGDTCPIHEGG
jgi:hypothetical protein